ncbi:hypothetical protein BCR43DRAFT_495652 [Syncephalastrum racemosum]|uniref:Uncharacterized protein n=1 Tax=Syncephalastrum racemosum TaxID=13706 RepID=A0A1X2H669_SYNRA|nr:hypothetical protein BCR43DRAFT_495652 [Syncephalastrum racemosum]
MGDSAYLSPYTQQMLSYYQQQQQQQQPNYGMYGHSQSSSFHAPQSPAISSYNLSQAALLGGLQQQYQQEQQLHQPQQPQAEVPRSNIIRSVPPPSPSAQNYQAYHNMPAGELEEYDQGEKTTKAGRRRSGFFLMPSKPNFWSPRDTKARKRKSMPSLHKRADDGPAMPGGFPDGNSPPPAYQAHTPQQQQQQQSPAPPPPPPQAQAPPPPPPFSMPQIPAGGYLYYCPPQPVPESPPMVSPEPTVPQRKAMSQATMYNPRQVPARDRCAIM